MLLIWWKMVKFYFFLKIGEMVKNGDLNFNFFSHKYFISSLEYISMIVYTNVENHLFSSLRYDRDEDISEAPGDEDQLPEKDEDTVRVRMNIVLTRVFQNGDLKH